MKIGDREIETSDLEQEFSEQCKRMNLTISPDVTVLEVLLNLALLAASKKVDEEEKGEKHVG